MEPGVTIPTLSRINPVPRIDTYSFKIHSNIAIPSTFKILKTLLSSFILATWPVHFNLLDLITLIILGKIYMDICKRVPLIISFIEVLSPTTIYHNGIYSYYMKCN